MPTRRVATVPNESELKFGDVLIEACIGRPSYFYLCATSYQ